jgi:hypothetical protein
MYICRGIRLFSFEKDLNFPSSKSEWIKIVYNDHGIVQIIASSAPASHEYNAVNVIYLLLLLHCYYACYMHIHLSFVSLYQLKKTASKSVGLF